MTISFRTCEGDFGVFKSTKSGDREVIMAVETRSFPPKKDSVMRGQKHLEVAI